ncbi:MAG TPA: ABC transporter substrate-binding protein [Firmicutes bacterium]|nr:ABC transporter substrate-binding protein [Bacillota bacterium]
MRKLRGVIYLKRKIFSLILVVALLTLIVPVLSGRASQEGQRSEKGASPNVKKLKTVKIANYGGGVCFSPLYVAKEKGFFEKEGLNAELVRVDFEGTKEGLATGKIDAALGLFYKWIKPVEQGMDIKFTAGLHTGCIQVVAGKNSGVTKVEDLRRKRIGVDAIGAGPMNFLAIALTRAGIDWQKDITWRAYPADQLETALDKGEIDAVAITDPFGQFILDKGKGRLILSLAETKPYRDEYCCFVTVSGKTIKKDPEAAAAITRALMNATLWVDEHRDEAAALGIEKKYTGGTPSGNARLLAKYKYVPSVKKAQKDLLQAIKDLKAAGVLNVAKSPEALAEEMFIPVTEGIKK